MGSIDPARLSRWFVAYAAALSLYARQWLDSAVAEDVVQDVFISLMTQRSEPVNIKAWLFRSTRNAAISRLRSEKRRGRREERATGRRSPWFEAPPEALIDAATAQAALTPLPEDQREVVVLRIWATLTLQEIADIVGQPVSTIFSRYRIALKAIRERLESSCRTKSR